MTSNANKSLDDDLKHSIRDHFEKLGFQKNNVAKNGTSQIFIESLQAKPC